MEALKLKKSLTVFKEKEKEPAQKAIKKKGLKGGFLALQNLVLVRGIAPQFGKHTKKDSIMLDRYTFEGEAFDAFGYYGINEPVFGEVVEPVEQIKIKDDFSEWLSGKGSEAGTFEKCALATISEVGGF